MTIDLRHALMGLSDREVYTLGFILGAAKKEGVTLSELADFFLVEKGGVSEIRSKIREDLPW
ncbi:MAG TPA: hypothetical protein DEP04_05715 [Dehalococcoidia bacterium]|nr:hypothetical protein [Dehalococcoidia bacterium]|tara:strand:- start:251 stop:436 length:186 start_codon:yes stop_codon:yes gene_type:complete